MSGQLPSGILRLLFCQTPSGWLASCSWCLKGVPVAVRAPRDWHWGHGFEYRTMCRPKQLQKDRHLAAGDRTPCGCTRTASHSLQIGDRCEWRADGVTINSRCPRCVPNQTLGPQNDSLPKVLPWFQRLWSLLFAPVEVPQTPRVQLCGHIPRAHHSYSILGSVDLLASHRRGVHPAHRFWGRARILCAIPLARSRWCCQLWKRHKNTTKDYCVVLLLSSGMRDKIGLQLLPKRENTWGSSWVAGRRHEEWAQDFACMAIRINFLDPPAPNWNRKHADSHVGWCAESLNLLGLTWTLKN